MRLRNPHLSIFFVSFSTRPPGKRSGRVFQHTVFKSPVQVTQELGSQYEQWHRRHTPGRNLKQRESGNINRAESCEDLFTLANFFLACYFAFLHFCNYKLIQKSLFQKQFLLLFCLRIYFSQCQAR